MIPLHEVSDPAFAEGILGVGVAVIPAEGCVYAPVDGTVAAAFPTGHAIGLMSDDGMEVLIHVGIDTVTMKGDGFSLKVGQGDRVTRGQLLLTFEPEKIEAAGHETTTMVLVSNAANLGTLEAVSYTNLDVYKRQGGKLWDIAGGASDGGAGAWMHRGAVRDGAFYGVGIWDGDCEPGVYCGGAGRLSGGMRVRLRPVSYTHLDVYKRQVHRVESVAGSQFQCVQHCAASLGGV